MNILKLSIIFFCLSAVFADIENISDESQQIDDLSSAKARKADSNEFKKSDEDRKSKSIEDQKPQDVQDKKPKSIEDPKSLSAEDKDDSKAAKEEPKLQAAVPDSTKLIPAAADAVKKEPVVGQRSSAEKFNPLVGVPNPFSRSPAPKSYSPLSYSYYPAAPYSHPAAYRPYSPSGYASPSLDAIRSDPHQYPPHHFISQTLPPQHILTEYPAYYSYPSYSYYPQYSHPAPAPAPAYAPVHVPIPAPVHAPVPVPAPAPAPEHTPESVPAPAPAPEHKPAPAPEPEHVPAPAPAPEHIPAPAPVPAPEYIPAPQPAPAPLPAPAPAPAPVPAPAPAYAPDYQLFYPAFPQLYPALTNLYRPEAPPVVPPSQSVKPPTVPPPKPVPDTPASQPEHVETEPESNDQKSRYVWNCEIQPSSADFRNTNSLNRNLYDQTRLNPAQYDAQSYSMPTPWGQQYGNYYTDVNQYRNAYQQGQVMRPNHLRKPRPQGSMTDAHRFRNAQEPQIAQSIQPRNFQQQTFTSEVQLPPEFRSNFQVKSSEPANFQQIRPNYYLQSSGPAPAWKKDRDGNYVPNYRNGQPSNYAPGYSQYANQPLDTRTFKVPMNWWNRT